MDNPKIGSRVRLVSNAGSFKTGDEGTVVFIQENDSIAVEFDTPRDGHTCSGRVKSGNGRWLNHSKFIIIKSTTKTTSFMSLISQFKNITRKEPEKTFVKAGVMNESLELTAEGQALFLTYLLEKHQDAFKADVVDAIVAEMDKESK